MFKYNHPIHKYPCALFPWLGAKEWHHTNYHRFYKGEIYWIDMLPLSDTAHWIIHGLFGGAIWMKGAVGRQNKIAKWLKLKFILGYPNPAQRLLHMLCRINLLFFTV